MITPCRRLLVEQQLGEFLITQFRQILFAQVGDFLIAQFGCGSLGIHKRNVIDFVSSRCYLAVSCHNSGDFCFSSVDAVEAEIRSNNCS